MSGKPAARLGDPTACPKKGHGTNPIASGSPNVLFDDLPAARQGDVTACGSVLTGNVIPNVLINGKPAVTLDSIGDHGNVVIGGSGMVIIGNSHTPAPFVPPKPLAALAVPASPVLPQQPATPMARAWQEEPGGIAKAWVGGPCLESIEIGRFEAAISKVGPYGGKSDGHYYFLSDEAKAYVEQHGTPYNSW